MTTLDGAQRFLDIIREIAGDTDKLNAMLGIGLVLRTGVVRSGPPTVTVSMDGMSSMGDEFLLEEAEGDLLVPEDMVLVQSDTVILAPMSKRQWVVLKKTRNQTTSPIDRVKIGVNLDRTGGTFAGIEIVIDPDTGATTVALHGDSVLINGVPV